MRCVWRGAWNAGGHLSLRSTPHAWVVSRSPGPAGSRGKKQQTLSSADVETGPVIIRNRPLGFSEWWHRTVGRQTLLQVGLSHMLVFCMLILIDRNPWIPQVCHVIHVLGMWKRFLCLGFYKIWSCSTPNRDLQSVTFCAWFILCRSSVVHVMV